MRDERGQKLNRHAHSNSRFVVTQYRRLDPAIDVKSNDRKFDDLLLARQFAKGVWAEGDHELVKVVEYKKEGTLEPGRLHFVRQSSSDYEPIDLFDGSRFPVGIPSFAVPFTDYYHLQLDVDRYRLFYGWRCFAAGNAARSDTIESLLAGIGDDPFLAFAAVGFSFAKLNAVSTRQGIGCFFFEMEV